MDDGEVDVGAKSVQRHAAFHLHDRPAHLGAAEAAGETDLDALGAAAHRLLHGVLHGTAVRNAAGDLLGDALADQAWRRSRAP